MRHWFIVSFALVVSGLSFAAETWNIDTDHASAGFRVSHLAVSNVRGDIGGMKGTVTTEGTDATKTAFDVTLDPATINTNNKKRDEHLRNADFLDVTKFKTMAFKSTSVTEANGKLTVVGNLTMHGVTKPITLENVTLTPAAKDPWGNTRRGLTASGKLNRREFGLIWNKVLETGGVAVGEEVDLNIDAELIAAKPEAEKTAKKEKAKK